MRKSHSEKTIMASITIALIIVLIVATVAITVGIYAILQVGPSKNQDGSDSNTEGPSFVLTTMNELLGNFSEMRFDYMINSSIPSQDANASISYALIGHPTINGTILTEYVFAFSTYGASGSQTSNSTLIYYNLKQNVVLATINGMNYTGSNTVYADFLVLPFNIFLDFQKYFFENTSAISSFRIVGSSNQSFGNLEMPVTTYQGAQIHYQDEIAQNMTVKVGQPPGKDLELTTFVSILGATSKGSSQGSLVVNLISATESGT